MTLSPADFKTILSDVAYFALAGSGLRLRIYQRSVARAICDSVFHNRGLAFVVIFPRQSGKNELQAQIEAYLLRVLFNTRAEIVKVSPTWKPQSLNAMRRLERVLQNNIFTRDAWVKESGYIYRLGWARVYFLSGAPVSNIVGATASTLLECDEAQDVLVDKWDKEISPMAASTNATRVFWGTAWTSQTLLAREYRSAQLLSERDGIQRVFRADARTVAAEVPAYGRFVDSEIARLGADHPSVRSQYFSQEIDLECGMFPAARRALMQGDHPYQESPIGHLRINGGLPHITGVLPAGSPIYAFMIDVGGEDAARRGASLPEDGPLDNPQRDSTALTVVQIDLSQLAAWRAPCYRVVQRRQWTGDPHTTLFGQIAALVEAWQPRTVICDSTGVGAGLASFLLKAFGEGRVLPFVFNAASKSRLGWDFLAVVETGRFRDHARPNPAGPGAQQQAALQEFFWEQIEHTQMEILPGPNRALRWGVPDGMRSPASGQALHDDLVVSAALCALLDRQNWGLAESRVLRGYDPLEHLDEY